MTFPTFAQALIVSALIRCSLVLYSEYHDANSVLKYTDVDYRVFTDAARFLLNPGRHGANQAQGWLGIHIGESVTTLYSPTWRTLLSSLSCSPYSRDTYRYTPLLALLMTPNELLHPSFGKYVFSLCDLLVGAMLYSIFCTFPPVTST